VNHEVLNQAPALVDYNLFATDRALKSAVAREGAGWACGALDDFGGRMGSVEVIEWGAQANENPPVLHTHDRFGYRRDLIEFHPAWHNVMRTSMEAGIHHLPWASPRPGAHVARAALAMMASQNEAGHVCPLSMTYSVVPVLRRHPELAAEWEPRLHSNRYDASTRPAGEKHGVLMGMAMTEKQGGSDVRANTTRAERIGGDEYALTGHKWFCSAPMSDAFLVLAQAQGRLTCFFLPRFTPDGKPNGFHIQRLKSKLGNRSNASGEVEFDAAWARRIGEEGRGVATIIEMVNHTRLDCVMGAASLMRQALVQAMHHARHRHAFGKALIDQPLMRGVLADLALESEAATLLLMRIARAFDEEDRPFARLAVAAGKFWVAKRVTTHVGEALECLGGNGYVEESPMPRLYREAPLNSIWEGSGNVLALDVLRAIRKDPGALDAVRAEIALCGDRRVTSLALDPVDEPEARGLAERIALALEASLMLRFSPGGESFCASRIEGRGGRTFGSLPSGLDLHPILESAFS
jgi:putative acyl-CoA dehydrogenase